MSASVDFHDSELDALVASSIREVVDAVKDVALVDAPSTALLPDARSPPGRKELASRPATVTASGPAAAAPAKEVSSSCRPDTIDPALLEVPSSSDATVRLLRARIKALESQLRTAVSACQDKDKALTQQERDLKALQAEKAGWVKQQKALEVQLEKQKAAADAAQKALSLREQQVKETTKDGAKADKERRAVELEARSREVRLQRALEEVERYKQLLQDAKTRERDSKDSAKGDTQQLRADVKKLERQKGELVTAFKKQLKLIDVLKRQRAHLEAARGLALTEEMFMAALEGSSA